MDAFPSRSEELLKFLDEAYPHRCIGRKQSPEDAHRYAGARDLIDNLLAWRERSDAKRSTADRILES